MKTFITVNLALAPFLVFSILLGFTTPLVAIVAALLLSIAGCAWRLRKRETKNLEIGIVAIFAGLGIADLIAPAFIGANAAAISFAGLGSVALATVAMRKPWTADYSRADYPDAAETPIFQAVNMAISALWGVVFLLIATARMLEASVWITTCILVAGTLISIFAPKLLVRFAMARFIAAQETYKWPAPEFGTTKDDTDFDVAVIGAGIGGLTAAALLADAGLKVVVAEQHVVPGGYCHTFLRKERHDGLPCLYRFDAGPHDFSGAWPGGSVASVLERLGVAQEIEWLRVDHTYHLPNLTIAVPRDWHDYVRELQRLFPASAAGIEKLFADIHAIFDGMMATGRDNGGIPGLPRTVDGLLAFPRDYPLAVHWLGRPFAELVAQHVQDPKALEIINALTGYISDKADVLTCGEMVPLFGYYFYGGFYPKGGSGRFADVLVEAIEARGGEVRLKSAVASIAIEHGHAAGLVLDDGSRISAKAVVSNADMKRTFLELVDQRHLPEDFRARIAAAEPATSAFMVHLGIDFVPQVTTAQFVRGGFGVGVETLSLIDPTAAPAGHATVGIITLLPHTEAKKWFSSERGDDDWKDLRQSADYEKAKRDFGDRMIAAAEKAIPGLASHIVHRSDASPVTYARYDFASAGSIYGIAKSGRLKGAKSPVPGLVVAGSATHGAGVEAALISGAWAAEALVPGLLARKGGKPAADVAEVPAEKAAA